MNPAANLLPTKSGLPLGALGSLAAQGAIVLASVLVFVVLTVSHARAEEEGSGKRGDGSASREEGSGSRGEGSDTRADSGSGSRESVEGGAASREGGAASRGSSHAAVHPVATQVDADLGEAVAESAAKIDRLVLAKLRAEKQRPNPLTNDMQFVRRIYLDITGTIPTGRQTAAFLRKSRGSDKRAELIDELLNSRGYVSHSFNAWADLLRLHDRPSSENFGRPYSEWIKDVLASDMPYDDFVHRMLSAEGRVWENPAVGYTLRDLGMPLSNLDNTVRIFLGTRIGCAQCHDHPFDRWTQKEFYQLAAFVHGTNTSANRLAVDRATAGARKELRELPKSDETRRIRGSVNRLMRYNKRSVGENLKRRLKLPHDYQYDDGKPGEVVQPAVIFGDPPELTPGNSRREAFATWVTSPENPRFTLTIANRLWKRALGVGVIEPVDDLTEESEPTNPELMDFLVSELKRVGYRQREFLRILYNTQTYQREASRRERAADEAYHFAGPVLRRMTAEQVWDSLLTLTLADPNGYERPRSDKLFALGSIDAGTKFSLEELQEKAKLRRAEDRKGEEVKLRKKYTYEGVLLVRASEMRQPVEAAHFLRQFGQSDRQLLAGGSTEGHVPQILTMFNGEISHKLLHKGTVIYDEVMMASELRDKIDVIFLSVLSRKPTRTDRKLAVAEIQSNGLAGFGNVIWALLNTREFLFIQ